MTLTGESLSISVGLDRGFRGLLVEKFEVLNCNAYQLSSHCCLANSTLYSIPYNGLFIPS